MSGDVTQFGSFFSGSGVRRASFALIVLLATAGSQAASAPFTFAQFIQATQSGNSNQFAYLDNGPTKDAELTTQAGGVNGVSIPIIFTFQALNSTLPADLQGPQQATLTLTSSSVRPVQTVMAFRTLLGDQQIFGDGAAPDVLTITRDTPAAEGNGTKTDLLTMTFTGSLLGQIGDTTPSLSGNTSTGDTVTYASDFLSFGSGATDDYNMAFSSWTTTATGGGLSQSTTGGDSFFASATAAGAATFDSSVTPVITSVLPEPSIASLGLAIGLMTLMIRRRPAVRA